MYAFFCVAVCAPLLNSIRSGLQSLTSFRRAVSNLKSRKSHLAPTLQTLKWCQNHPRLVRILMIQYQFDRHDEIYHLRHTIFSCRSGSKNYFVPRISWTEISVLGSNIKVAKVPKDSSHFDESVFVFLSSCRDLPFETDSFFCQT